MSAPLPFVCDWDGESFTPIGRSAKECDANFVIGMRYRLSQWQDRSQATHNHEFAFVAEAWRQLPEDLADEYPSAEHLRKRALIQAGYFDEMVIDAGSNAAALRVATALRAIDDFALVIVRGHFVVRRTAKSQSRRAMSPKDFQDSKSKIMEIVSALIGVSPDTLARNTNRAA
jgi:hypothetical protein